MPEPPHEATAPVCDEDCEPGPRQYQGRSGPHHVALQGAGAPVVDQRAGLQPCVVGGPQRLDGWTTTSLNPLRARMTCSTSSTDASCSRSHALVSVTKARNPAWSLTRPRTGS